MSEGDFTQYVQQNYDRFVRFASKLARSHADDLVQATVLKLWVRLEGIDPPRLDLLFFTALKNACIDHWRQQARRHDHAGAGARIEADRATPERISADREVSEEVRQHLRDARSALNPRERRALAVWLIAHPPREQASALLGINPSGYSAAVHSGLQKLKQFLTPQQPFLQAALEALGPAQVFTILTDGFADDYPQQSGGQP